MNALHETECPDCRYEVRGQSGYNERIFILNCSLHDAAPALLTALEAAQRWLKDVDNERRWEMAGHLQNHIAAAIRQAKGESA